MADRTLVLDAVARTLAETEEVGALFNVLIAALPGVAPRGAIFVVRQRRYHGWSSFGYPADAARRQAAFSAPLEDGRLGRAAAETPKDVERRRGGDPDFGQALADESLVAAVSVKGRPIAAILLERHRGGEPWDPSALGVLRAVAGLRLELTLARRKLRTTESDTAPSVCLAGAQVQLEPTFWGETEARVEAPSAAETPGARSAARNAPDPVLEAARRFARLVATDIRLYNEEAVALGRQHRDLAERLLPSIHRGKATFVERHGALGDRGLDLLREAYVHVLAAGDANLLPSSLLK